MRTRISGFSNENYCKKKNEKNNPTANKSLALFDQWVLNFKLLSKTSITTKLKK